MHNFGNQNNIQQPVDEYGEEQPLIDEMEEELDEDGQPVPSPEQVRDIINAISSFKFEESSSSS